METTRVYAVDRVYDDLKTPFVAKDLIKQLSELDIVVGDIFTRVSLKVAAEKTRVGNINARLRVCQAKVHAIHARRTSNKPTTVFSTSKYPAPKVLPAVKTLFYDKPYAETPVVVPDTDEDAHFLPAEGLPAAQRAKVTAEVVDLFEHVNPYCERSRGEVDMSKEGLGRLPECIPSIGNVLLFNSGENPYQKYTSWDNLLGVDYEEAEEERKQLASAPKTLVDGDQLPAVHGENVDFRPTMGTVEDLSKQLPTNLPLENIAEYQYTVDAEANASIAPSLFQDKALPDLPPVETFANAPTAQEPSQESAPIGPGDEPPPPPPPPPAVDFTQEDVNEPPPPPPPQPVEDDLPPPPPPVAEDGDAPPPPDQESAPTEEPPAEKNSFVSLMDQIRNPNFKLRKVTASENRADPLDKTSGGKKPLTIADEVMDRMRRRQAAISGKQDQLEQKRDRERMAKPVEVLTAQEVTPPSATAPPPPPPSADTLGKNRLPTVDMSDDGSEAPADRDSDHGSTEENDSLAQIRNIRNRMEQQRSTQQPAAERRAPTPQPEQQKVPLMDFESQMRGLRNREESLSMSEGSDWSDE